MKKHSLEAKDLLNNAEMFEIKAGGDFQHRINGIDGSGGGCGICTTCLGCTNNCTACTSRMLDVIIP